MFFSSFSLIYALDRKVHRLSKFIVPLTAINLAASIMEFLKFEIPTTRRMEMAQDVILLFLPPLYYLLLLELSTRQPVSKTKTNLLLAIPTVYSILALTNGLHNAFWVGERRTDWYVEPVGVRAGPILRSYYLFVFTLLLMVVFETVRFLRSKRILLERFIVVAYAVGWFLAVWVFLQFRSYTFLIFLTSSVTLAIELTAVRSFWRRSILGLRMKVFDTADQGYLAVDKSGTVIDANKKALELLGMSQSTLLGRHLSELRVPSATDEGLMERNNKLILIRRENASYGDIYILKDVTESMVGAKKQREISELMRTLFENIPEGAVILKENGIIVDCNRQFEHMFGYTREELIGRRIEEFIVPPELFEEPQLIRKTAIEQGSVRFRTIRKRKSGETFEVDVNVVRVNVPYERLLYAIYTDLSLEREYLRTSQLLLTKDRLTGLFNKEYFVKKLMTCAESGESPYPCNVVVLLDIADFNLINASRGHSFGDQILKKVAERLSEILRKDDVIARGTSDEFWILFRNFASTVREAVTRLDGLIGKVLDRLESSMVIDGQTVDLKFRAGVYVFDQDSYEEVLKKASIALSEAKNRAQRIFIYEPELDVKYLTILEREKLFKDAFYAGRVVAFFQPICTSTGRIVGAEALLRVLAQDGTVLPPAEFIPLLERNGMIHIVGEEILRQSCELLNRTQIRFVNINVSPIQLRNRNFSERFYDIALQHNVDPSKVVVEITENIILGENEVVISNIKALERIGFELCVDDFGTGYSSLQYLVDYPIKKLKVDRNFVRELSSKDRKAVKILEAIYGLSSSLGIEAIPEGVETVRQLQILTMIGFKLFQGFLFSKALPMEDFVRLTNEGISVEQA